MQISDITRIVKAYLSANIGEQLTADKISEILELIEKTIEEEIDRE